MVWNMHNNGWKPGYRFQPWTLDGAIYRLSISNCLLVMRVERFFLLAKLESIVDLD